MGMQQPRRERVDFETWAARKGYNLERGDYGAYVHVAAHDAWQVWQARADMPERLGAEKWVLAEERRPEPYVPVLVWVGGAVDMGFWCDNRTGWQMMDGYALDAARVRGWLPLPTAPEGWQ